MILVCLLILKSISEIAFEMLEETFRLLQTLHDYWASSWFTFTAAASRAALGLSCPSTAAWIASCMAAEISVYWGSPGLKWA